MKRYLSNAALKNMAKDKLTGQFSNALFALLTVRMVTNIVSSMVVTMVPGGGMIWDIIALLLSAVVSAFLGILQTGIAYYFLNIASGRRAAQSHIFYGFQECTEKSLKISAVHVLAQTLCMLPYQIAFLSFTRTSDYRHLLIALMIMLIGYLVLIPIDLALSQTFYLLLDFSDASADEIIKTSIRVMKGHKKRLFLLQLSFLPLYLLCMLTLGIGLLWLNPYMQMTYTLFFLDLMNPGHLNHNSDAGYYTSQNP